MKQNKEYIDLFNNIEHKREFYIARKFAIPYFENLIEKMLDKQILNKAGDAINMFAAAMAFNLSKWMRLRPLYLTYCFFMTFLLFAPKFEPCKVYVGRKQCL